MGFTGNWSVLMSYFDDPQNKQADLIVPRLNDVFARSWKWFKMCKEVECKRVETRTQIFWPIARCSPLFVRILDERLRQGGASMHEAFADPYARHICNAMLQNLERSGLTEGKALRGVHFVFVKKMVLRECV